MTDMIPENRTVARNQEIHWPHKRNDDTTKKETEYLSRHVRLYTQNGIYGLINLIHENNSKFVTCNMKDRE